MKVVRGNNFLYFGDKNVADVSGVWKALHISIYIALAVNAFVTSMAAGNMFQTFKYNCILFCNEIGFEKELMPAENIDYSIRSANAELESTEITENYTFLTNGVEQNVTDNLLGTTTILPSTNEMPNKSSDNVDFENRENNTIIFKNQSHIFQNEDDAIVIIHGKIDLRKTRFASDCWCNFVLGIALMTFVFATFCAVILAMCSKGGKGRNNTLNRPQNMVYPILFSSLLLGVLNLIASIIVKSGMQEFCASFELFTQEQRCSSLINQFTLHERQENFYLPYLVLSHSVTLTIILFLCQVLVTTLRIIYAVDYQLYALEVDEKEELDDFEIEDGHIKNRTSEI